MRGRTYIYLRQRTQFCAAESLEEVKRRYEDALLNDEKFLSFESVNGQTAFPPVRCHVLLREIISLQEVSEEAWVWQQQADTLHYAQQLQASPQEEIAHAQKELVSFLKEQTGDE